MGKNPNTLICAQCWDKNGTGSGISLLHLWADQIIFEQFQSIVIIIHIRSFKWKLYFEEVFEISFFQILISILQLNRLSFWTCDLPQLYFYYI